MHIRGPDTAPQINSENLGKWGRDRLDARPQPRDSEWRVHGDRWRGHPPSSEIALLPNSRPWAGAIPNQKRPTSLRSRRPNGSDREPRRRGLPCWRSLTALITWHTRFFRTTSAEPLSWAINADGRGSPGSRGPARRPSRSALVRRGRDGYSA